MMIFNPNCTTMAYANLFAKLAYSTFGFDVYQKWPDCTYAAHSDLQTYDDAELLALSDGLLTSDYDYNYLFDTTPAIDLYRTTRNLENMTTVELFRYWRYLEYNMPYELTDAQSDSHYNQIVKVHKIVNERYSDYSLECDNAIKAGIKSVNGKYLDMLDTILDLIAW